LDKNQREMDKIQEDARREGRLLTRTEMNQVKALEQQQRGMKTDRLQELNLEIQNLTSQGMSFGDAITNVQAQMNKDDPFGIEQAKLGLVGGAASIIPTMGRALQEQLGDKKIMNALKSIGWDKKEIEDLQKRVDPRQLQAAMASGDPASIEKAQEGLLQAQEELAIAQKAASDPAYAFQLLLKRINEKLITLVREGLTVLEEKLREFKEWLHSLGGPFAWLADNLGMTAIALVGFAAALSLAGNFIIGLRRLGAAATAFGLRGAGGIAETGAKGAGGIVKGTEAGLKGAEAGVKGTGAAVKATEIGGETAIKGAEAAGELGLFSRMLKPVSSGLGKLAKILPFLDIAIGGLIGGLEAEGAGRGTGEGVTLGALTGGATRGSMFSGMLGVEKGSKADDVLGIGGAAAGGALTGGLMGAALAPITGGLSIPIGAALGGLAGGIAEIYKIATDTTSSLYKVTQPVLAGLTAAWNALTAGMSLAWNAIKSSVMDVVNLFVETFSGGAFKDFGSWIDSIDWEGIFSVLGKGLKIVGEGLGALAMVIGGALGFVIRLVTGIFRALQ
jgi:uncharacterized protein YoaH (UPF0181 family)